MDKTKKILIIAGGVFLLILAIVTALNILSTGTNPTRFGSNSAGVPGLSNRSFDSGSGPESISNSSMEMANQKATVPLPSGVSSDITEGVSPQDTVQISNKIIKNGNLTIKVNSADEASQKITYIAKSEGGIVFSSNIWKNASGIKSGIVTIKVPVDKFDETLAALKKVAALVVRESTDATDVTEQYVDLVARLENKKAEEKAFADILTRSGQIDDILKVTKELSRVRGEIEILEGQKKLLDSRSDMSTISVSLSEDEQITISDSWRPLQVAKDAVNALVQKVQKFINFVIILVVTVIPVLALYILLIFIFYLIIRKIYKKLKKNKTNLEIPFQSKP